MTALLSWSVASTGLVPFRLARCRFAEREERLPFWCLPHAVFFFVPKFFATMHTPAPRSLVTGSLIDAVRHGGAADVVALIEDGHGFPEILVDQGDVDNFLEMLLPQRLEGACGGGAVDLTLRMQPGYGHAYYFVSTFMDDHMRWHAARLCGD